MDAECIERGSRSVYHRCMKSLLVLVPVVFFCLAPVHAQSLPEGPGKSVFENTCGGCHGADIVIGQTGTRDVWQDTVDSMRSRGALGTDEDFKTIVNYLTTYFGVPVNVNTAAAKELVDNLNLTSAEADAIVKARDKSKFKDYSDLAKVDGLDMKKLDPIKSRIKF
jgi:hypothetical protein